MMWFAIGSLREPKIRKSVENNSGKRKLADEKDCKKVNNS